MNTTINHIIQNLEELDHGKPWIGSTLTKKLGQVSEADYFRQPMEGMHSVAAILSHITLWRSEAVLKINTGEGSKTDDCEENWLPNHKLEAKGWDAIKAEYDNALAELIALLRTKNDDFLSQEYYDTDFKGRYTYQWLLNGMVQHDAYHLGQLGIIIKFLNKG